MPFGTYTLSTVGIASLPEEKGPRVRDLFGIHTRLTEEYGVRYAEINGILSDARSWATEADVGGLTVAQKEEIVAQVAQVRTDAVLFFKTLLKRAEFLINELLPGAFPVPGDQPLESVDPDDVFKLGAGIAALGAAITAGGGAPVGVPVAAFGAGMMIGSAIGSMLWD